MASPPLKCHLILALCFYGSPGFLHKHSWLWISSLLSPQAVSLQPTAVLSPGLLSKPHVPTPRPCAHQWTLISGRGMQGCGTDCLCRSHSVLPATDQLLHSLPIASEAPLLPQLIFPQVSVLPWMQEPLLSFSYPTQGCRSHPASSPLLFPFSFPSSYPVMQGSFLSF